jgi:hypothetical protein
MPITSELHRHKIRQILEIESFLGIPLEHMSSANNLPLSFFGRQVMKENIRMLGINEVCDSREITIR